MRFKTIGLAVAGAALAGCCASRAVNAAYPETVDEGFVSLFNGKDLTGWFGSHMYGVETLETKLNNGTVKHENVLACYPDRRAKDDCGNLLTERQYRNFVLRFEVLLCENGDSGLGIRVPDAEVDAAYGAMCEVQLLDDGGSDYLDRETQKDKIYPYQYAGSVFGIAPARRDNVNRQIWGKEKNFAAGGSYMRRAGLWNFVEVTVIGDTVEVWLNGYPVSQADLSRFAGDGDTPDGRPHPGIRTARGHVGWLCHDHAIKWKNIRIRELPDDARPGAAIPCRAQAAPQGFTAYFDGEREQLQTMWKGVTTDENFDNPIVREAAAPEKRAEMQKKADAQRNAHWHVVDGSLYFDGYRGGYSLATAKDLKDFELWADWRTLSITGDSGLYLRGAPQVQIWDAHNQWGIGSGGLYNNQKNPRNALEIADRQVGDWNRFHVVMKGEKVTVWLNGVLVVDNVTLENYWDRQRAIFPVGQLELQCHGDPTEWRNIYIREL